MYKWLAAAPALRRPFTAPTTTSCARVQLANAFRAPANKRTFTLQSLLAKPSASRLADKSQFFSRRTIVSAAEVPPALPSKSVGIWLMVSSTLVFAIVVVGGVTRLTESGLSITEWKPITGIIPPLTHAQWEEEFEKYKLSPEFKLLNHAFTLEDYQRIFFLEWAHRVLGRVLGVAFVGPLVYFVAKKQVSRPLAVRLGAMALLIGAQGLMGWYMVKSGLEESLMTTPGAVPRVSQYRLAAHLGLAFVLYAGMFSTGMAIIKDWKFAVRGTNWMGLKIDEFLKLASSSPFRRFKVQAWGITGLVLITALSGAFVAGLDAGLLYNEFPLMGGRLMPPTEDLMAPAYAKKSDKSDLWWRNMLENPTTVQFDHRLLATTTYTAVGLLFAQTFSKSMKASLPPAVRRATLAAFGMVNIQLALGIFTLITLVPVPLAAAHQAGSVLLLSAMMHVLICLRRPSLTARAWKNALSSKPKA